MNLKVLWTISSSMGTASDIDMLKKSDGFDIDVVTTDMNDKDSIGFVLTGKKHIVPSGKHPEYIDRILEVCSSDAVTTIIPQYGDELVPLCKNINKFERKGVKVLVSSDPYKLEIANNKEKLFEFFKGSSFVPRYRCVSDLENVERAVYSMGYPDMPVCIKPVYGEGGKGVKVVTKEAADVFSEQGCGFKTSWEALKDQMLKSRSLPELMVMEYLPDSEYSVDCVCKDGRTLVAIPRQRLETSMGVATVTITEKNEELMDISAEIISKLNLSYNVNIQFKYGSNGRPKLVEVNPRVSGSLVANLGAGVNMLELSLKLAYDIPFDSPSIDWGTKMIRYWDQVFIK